MPGARRTGLCSMIICKIEGCDRKVDSVGMCAAHYRRHRLYGNPFGGGPFRARPGQPRAFLEKAKTNKSDECLLWPFGHNGAGYGHLEIDGRLTLAHRLICEAFNGPAPDAKQEAAHLCGNGHLGCITGRHLTWKTRGENASDMSIHGTSMRGEKAHFAKLNAADVVAIREMAPRLSHSEIANIFGVSRSNVAYIIRRSTWRHVL